MVLKCMIEDHLQLDQAYYKTLQPNGLLAPIVKTYIENTIQLLSQINGGPLLPKTTSDVVGSHSEDSEDLPLQLVDTHSEDFGQLDGEGVESDDLFGPNNMMDIDLGSTDADAADPTLLGMDPNVSDSEMDQFPMLSEVGSGYVDYGSDDDDEMNLHPGVLPPSIGDDLDSFPERESDGLGLGGGNDSGAHVADIPEVVRQLRVWLFSDYTPPNHPPVDDPRGHILTPDEE
ncbi:hypothetical protein H4582DRAFT_2082727 [Lactarius indigo]|nr:hypothetical protein H4582DRAFT_2082727 [Lactarius indigo]